MHVLPKSHARRIHTPWGESQSTQVVAPGITRVDTASHGGYRLDAERQAIVEARFPLFTPWAGKPWYEEDQDWAVVAIVFPDAFPADAQEHARKTAAWSARPREWQGGLVDAGWKSVVDAIGA